MSSLVPTLSLAALQLESAVRPLGAAGPDLTRYFLVCAALVLLTGGLLLAFRKGLAATVRARAARRSLAVVDVLPLGGRHKLLVVRCYDRTFLLGAGDKELAPIAELDPATGLEAAGRKAPEPADREAFARTLETLRASLPAPRLGARTAGNAAALVPKAPPVEGPPPLARPPRAGLEPSRERAPDRPRLEGVVG